MICFKSQRDKTGIRHLLLQVYPEKWRRLLRLFLKLTARPFGPLMLDLHPASDDCFRIWSHLTKREGRPLLHTFDEDIKRQSIRAFRTSKRKKHDTVPLENIKGKTTWRHCTLLSSCHSCFSGRRKSHRYGWIRSGRESWDYGSIKILREKEV